MDSYAEFTVAASQVQPRHFDWLQRQGVPHDFLWRGAQRFGVHGIIPSNDGSYEPIDDGQRAVIIPTIPLLSPAEWCDDDDVDLEDIGDLVAWFPQKPGRWWVRTGSTPILNADAIAGAEIFDEALKVYSTPLDWMRAAGDGIVVLDPVAHLGMYLGSVRQLVCDTVELGREIDRRLRDPAVRLPQIFIPDTREAA